MDYAERTFENETVTLDRNSFTDCTFRNCIFEYAGGPCQFDGRTRFEGENTINFVGVAKNVYTIVTFLLRGIGFGIDQAMGQAPKPGQSVQ